MSFRNGGVGLLAAVLLAPAGCADATTAQVSGTVTVDGEPVADGTIRFTASDGQAPVTGGEVKDGRYSVRVPLGVMKVSISAAKVVGHKKIYPTPNSPEMPITAEALPARYNQRTELVLEVRPGTVSQNWELKSR